MIESSSQLTRQDIQKIRGFVRQSKGIPQLAKARMHAICLLSNLDAAEAPALGPQELVEFLKLSPLYERQCEVAGGAESFHDVVANCITVGIPAGNERRYWRTVTSAAPAI